ncbi:Vps62-related protein [Pseudomonas sp. COR58]|uniref:Vps62-related protein n=1 Tax=Pseudomonas ekonensis TaxID=2842353 RepID=A0ABS6PK14_9PSED|nr:Vps62-related protein [Pseudomonas ekonensis]MBV4460809.1 Vps62-related protein [Pseudomonas ekonensis]
MNTHEDTASPIRQMRPLRFDNLLINFTTEFYRVWDTQGSRAKPAAIWRPTPVPDLLPGYFPLGDVIVADLDNINGAHVVAVVCEAEAGGTDPAQGKALSQPVDYELIWSDSGTKSKKDGSLWRPVPPQGYVALGSVCSNDHEKPSLNAIRCVRTDLVVVSSADELIWNDKGSGAKLSFSAWSITPPHAPAGEIHLAPGTFAGNDSYSRPELGRPTYSLRVPIALQVSPQPTAPELTGELPARQVEPAKLTHTARLPWFTVKDPLLSPLEQLRHSPCYRLERTDQYRLIGHGRNPDSQRRTFRWTAPRAQRAAHLKTLAGLTTVEFGQQWPTGAPTPLRFSARLDEDFAQCGMQANEWFNERPLEVVTLAAGKRSVAAYLVQSNYTLLREDGKPVADTVSYTDGNRLHLCEHSPEETAFTCPSTPATAGQPLIETPPAAEEPRIEPAPTPDVPDATDTAP